MTFPDRFEHYCTLCLQVLFSTGCIPASWEPLNEDSLLNYELKQILKTPFALSKYLSKCYYNSSTLLSKLLNLHRFWSTPQILQTLLHYKRSSNSRLKAHKVHYPAMHFSHQNLPQYCNYLYLTPIKSFCLYIFLKKNIFKKNIEWVEKRGRWREIGLSCESWLRGMWRLLLLVPFLPVCNPFLFTQWHNNLLQLL